MSAYSEYLNGKRVVLVGPSGCLIGKKGGRAIDGYDVVVRLKKPIVDQRQYRDYGSRTDVLYVNLEASMWAPEDAAAGGMWHKAGIQWVIYSRKTKRRHTKIVRAGVKKWAAYRKISHRKLTELENHCRGSLPLTGVIAMWDLSRMPFAALHFTGFTFYRTPDLGHYPGFQDPEIAKTWSQARMLQYHNSMSRVGSSHYVPPQLNFIRDTVAQNPRITADSTLQGVFETT